MSQTEVSPEFPTPICPRCDYDLSGEVATWHDHCPLSSRCPECGLDVRWTAVYRIEAPPRWSIEHAEPQPHWRRLTLLKPVLLSACAAFLPRFLWRRLTLGMRVVPHRLALMLAVWLIAGYLLTVAVMLGTQYLAHILDHEAYLVQISASRYPIASVQYPSFWTHRDALGVLFPFFRLPGSTGVPPQPALLSILFAFTVPFALVLLPFSLRRAKVRPRHLLRLTAYWLIWLVPAAAFAAWTDALYRMLYPLDVFVTHKTPALLKGLTVPARRVIELVSNHSNALAALLLFLGVTWFWRQAARHYLRLPRPTLVSLGLVTLSMLLTSSIGFFIVPGGDDIVIQIIYELVGK